MKIIISILILLLFTIIPLISFYYFGFKLKDIIEMTKSIVEIVAIFIGIFFISTWKIDRKEQLKEDLQVSFNNIRKTILGYIDHPWFYLDYSYESQRTKKPSGISINLKARQEILDYRDVRISKISERIFQLKTKLNQSLYLARLHGIINEKTEDEIEKEVTNVSRELSLFLRTYGNVYCLKEYQIDEHTKNTREKESTILNSINDLGIKINKLC